MVKKHHSKIDLYFDSMFFFFFFSPLCNYYCMVNGYAMHPLDHHPHLLFIAHHISQRHWSFIWCELYDNINQHEHRTGDKISNHFISFLIFDFQYFSLFLFFFSYSIFLQHFLFLLRLSFAYSLQMHHHYM